MPVTRTLPSSARTQGLTANVDKAGVVTGEAAPGTRVEIANLSVAPTGHLMPTDVVEVATADAQGKFTLALPGALPGDVLEVHAREHAAAPSSSVQVRVDADDRGNDPRAAFVSLKRLRVDVDGTGGLTISSRTTMPLTEPDAVIRFTNQRTGKSVDVVVDPMGRIPATKLEGQLGDTIDVAVTDDIATRAPSSTGTLSVIVPKVSNPAPVASDRSASLVTVPGRLFLEKLGLGKQGSIGDCPVPAAASAIAAVDEDAIRELIRDRGDGTYAVTFHPRGKDAVEIVVDGQLYGRGSRPMYGAGQEKNGEVELWFPLVEKAYAALAGSYDELGKGISVGNVLEDFLGRANTEVWLKDASPDDVWAKMQRARTSKQSMACGTYPTAQRALYQGSGLYPNHAYSVVGLSETPEKGRMVTMRNPWGGSGFSGEFQLPLADFVKLYQVLNIC